MFTFNECRFTILHVSSRPSIFSRILEYAVLKIASFRKSSWQCSQISELFEIKRNYLVLVESESNHYFK